LGAFVGGIGLTVASITLFIVIFINAIAREKYIGIMKAIGIKSKIIKSSYVLQSIFYAVIGSALGFLILWLIMIPYFKQNPIDFPFSDGILAVSSSGIIIRIIILILSAIAAGYIPARIIVKKNTIDSLLGR
jgi:ABC-type antimicrobial peptide transport system permease subunit